MTKKKYVSRNRNDSGYANSVIGTNTSRDPSFYTTAKAVKLLSQLEVDRLYLGDGLGKRIVNTYPEEMLRTGFKLDGLNESVNEKIKVRFEELSLHSKLFEYLSYERAYGGSVIVFLANDGANSFDVPLNPNNLTEIEEIRVYDRYEVSESKKELNPMLKTYGQVTEYLISPANGGNPYYCHTSRMIVARGGIIPNRWRQINDNWGASCLQGVFDALASFGSSHSYVLTLLQRMQQAVHGIKDLQAILDSPGGSEAVKERVNVVDMVRGILNTIVIDSEESYDIKTNALTGVKDVLDKIEERLTATTDYPHFILFNSKLSGGMNNSGKGDLDSWYAKVAGKQETDLKPVLDKIVTMLLLELKSDAKYTIEFNPLKPANEKEEAETEKAKAEKEKIKSETIQNYVDMQAVDSSEVRTSLQKQNDLDLVLVGELELEPEVKGEELDETEEEIVNNG